MKIIQAKYIAEALEWIRYQYVPSLKTKISQLAPTVQRLMNEMEFETERKMSPGEEKKC